jgi:crotonobetainyl-CoA:carnitine CoA-transferase CaiB-like acyl-CoA transferase
VHALEGVVVVDFGQYLAGPFGPMVLGDLGADVIKVEPVAGDGMRMVNQAFFGCTRGKRDIALNIKSESGKKVALELIERADIVHHNMTAGVAKRLGIAYDDCKRVNPDVVYCNTWAYGLEGPLAHFGGLDPIFQAAAGLEYEAGPVRAGNRPLYIRFGMTDTANAMLSVVGCLAALYHQRRTGEGQELWTSLLDGASMLSSDALLVDGESVPRPQLDADQCGIDACYRLYRTNDDWIQIAAVKQGEFEALCNALGLPELATDPRFADRAARAEHREQLEALLAPQFASRTAIVWSRVLDDAGVPNEVPRETHAGETVFFDSDNVELGLVAEYEHPIVGAMRQFGALVEFSETPGRIAGPPALCGQHTKEILGWLGYDDAQMESLRAEGSVYWPDEDRSNYPWTV